MSKSKYVKLHPDYFKLGKAHQSSAEEVTRFRKEQLYFVCFRSWF